MSSTPAGKSPFCGNEYGHNFTGVYSLGPRRVVYEKIEKSLAAIEIGEFCTEHIKPLNLTLLSQLNIHDL